LDELRVTTGQLTVNETFGIMVLPNDVPVRVSSGSASGYAGTPRDQFTRALAAARSGPAITARERLAFDLYSAADFVSDRPEARFVVLMMAFEALIEAKMRDAGFQEHIDSLTRITTNATLQPGETQNLANALRALKWESARQAGRRVVAAMDGRLYNGKTPVTFFNECYPVRSALVHGAEDRPAREVVSRLAASLQVLVGHLIAGRALVDVVSNAHGRGGHVDDSSASDAPS